MTSFNCPSLLHLFLLVNLSPPPSLLSPPLSLLSHRKKKQGKGKKKGSDDSDSDDVEVIKEWNTSSRGRNGEGRNRRVSVEERKFVYICGHYGQLAGRNCMDGKMWGVSPLFKMISRKRVQSYRKLCTLLGAGTGAHLSPTDSFIILIFNSDKIVFINKLQFAVCTFYNH